MLGNKLKKLRERKGLNQSDIGKVVGVTASAIGMYERDVRIPDISILKKLASFFNVSIDWLVDHNFAPEVIDEVEMFKQKLVDKGIMSPNQELNDKEFNSLIETMAILKKMK